MNIFSRSIPVAALAAVVSLAGCAHQATSSSAANVQSVSVETTACYGFCPVYVATATADGQLHFDGKAHTPVTGMREVNLASGAWDKTLAALNAADFFALPEDVTPGTQEQPNNACGNYRTDAPTHIISATQGGVTHRVQFYIGCGDTTVTQRLRTLDETLRQTLGLEELSRSDH